MNHDPDPPRAGRYSRLRVSIGRHPLDLLRLVIAAAVVLACLVIARAPGANEVEVAIFHELQRLPARSDRAWTVVSWAGFWPGIVAGAGLALYLGRLRLAVAVVWAGVIAWLLVVIVHQLVGARVVPTELIDAARGPGPTGFLFPSRSTAVVTAIITAAGPYVTRFERYASWVLVVAVGIAAVFLGASLPVGAFAGVVLGWGVGTLIHLVLGAPGRRTAEPSVQSALHRTGLTPIRVVCTSRKMLRPQLYDVTTTNGDFLQVKVVRRLHRLDGPGHRLRRLLASLEVDPGPALTTPRHEVAHEAYITLLAERAGVGTLPVLLVGEMEHGPPFLIRRHVTGRRLSEMPADCVLDRHLDRVWGSLRDLGEVRILHHDLRAENILIDDQDEVRITDFTFGRITGPSTGNAQDVAEMLVSVASAVGVDRAVESAARQLSDETLEASLPHLQSLALHRRFRNQLAGSAVLAQLREVVAARLDTEVPPFRSPVRPRTVAIIAAGGLAVYLLLPEASNFATVRSIIADANRVWLAGSVVLGMLAVLASGLTILGSARPTLPIWRTMGVQIAAAFTGRTTVAAVGYYTIHLSFFDRIGMPRTEAVGVLLLNRAATVVVTGGATIGGFFVIGNAVPVGQVSVPWWLWLAAAAAVLVTIAFLASPYGRSRVWRPLRLMARRLLATVAPTLRRPVRAIQLVGGEVLFLACSAAAVATSLSAIGAHYALGAVIAVFVVASTLGQLLPTPGGLGAVEGALVAGLTAIGIAPADALAATLTARVLTFWLPVLPGIAAFRLLQHHQVI